ncbi:YcaO-like family protein [Actinokineospora auranticolor]|uniref:Bacteriocin biosynthesis cyclodehydratase domain-containing protein n=1 Tax=Actinokineospora auranticolor TaxID=155976 RepID=A0A2S6GNU6_9PSEU|nr:YcaO-like family protein [Actinokineospora auranticolor]PPK66801.1 bacteriocin biosynthesis cyclodehydratase domain-containing protein [Actinokineospora auranticolor]
MGAELPETASASASVSGEDVERTQVVVEEPAAPQAESLEVTRAVGGTGGGELVVALRTVEAVAESAADSATPVETGKPSGAAESEDPAAEDAGDADEDELDEVDEDEDEDDTVPTGDVRWPGIENDDDVRFGVGDEDETTQAVNPVRKRDTNGSGPAAGDRGDEAQAGQDLDGEATRAVGAQEVRDLDGEATRAVVGGRPGAGDGEATLAVKPRSAHPLNDSEATQAVGGPRRAQPADDVEITQVVRPVPVPLSVGVVRERLRREFGSAVVVLDAPGRVVPGTRLVVGINDNPDFDRWLRGTRLPVLTITLATATAHVGPLSIPDTPGCAGCARTRKAAARHATREAPPALKPSGRPALDHIADLVRAATKHGATDLVGHIVEVGAGEPLWHRVIPLAHCGTCGGAKGGAPQDVPETDDPAELLTALAGWVDPLTGVIPWITVHTPFDGAPHVATAAPPHVFDRAGKPRALPLGWGRGTDPAQAILAAVGEAVERYSASLPDPRRVVWARPADLDGEVLDPREFALYEPEQYAAPGFGYAPFDRRVDHPWVRGTWLGTDNPVWVPAVFSYLAMTLLPEHLICQGTSNGLAAALDTDAATVRATLELVERDAMMTTWLTGARGRYVELDDTLDPEVADAVDGLRAAGPTVEIYLLHTSRYGTTAVALAVGDGKRWPGAAIGLGADRSPRAAIRDAVFELARTAPHLATLLRDREVVVPARAQAVRGALDHAAFYFPADRVAAFDRLRCGGTSRLADLPEPAFDTTIDDLSGHLGSKGVRVAVVDVTSADVATGPFRVVRAVSPDLQPISHGFGYDRSPVARLRHAGTPVRRVIHPIW